MKLRILCLFLLLAITGGIGAQTIHEPNSDLYKDIDRWFVQGYIRTFLPLIRPYPWPLIESILQEVTVNGNTEAREKAAAYRYDLSPDSRSFRPGFLAYLQGSRDDASIVLAPFAEGLFHIAGSLTTGFHFAAYALSDTDGERFNVPGTYSPYTDFIPDMSNVGSLTVRQHWTSITSIGTSNVYFQAGLSRSSFGPFYDNGIVVGPQAPRAGHFSFVFQQPQWSFEMLLQAITASDDFGNGLYNNKFNIIHSINYRPLDNLEIGFQQAIVWGGRFELMYLVPFSFLFQNQSLFGFDDNAIMGLHVRWRPFNNLLVNSQLYVDDFHFNNFLKGTIQLKAAAQFGLSWTPDYNYINKVDFDYTMVLPYTYSHWNEPAANRYVPEMPNYLNYTHMGRNIGPDLEPNSVRFSVRTSWDIIPGIGGNLSAYLTGHGNASDGIESDVERHGSIFDDGFVEGRRMLRLSDFLSQSVIETRLGGALGVHWTIPTSYGIFKLSADYGMELGRNRRTRDSAPNREINNTRHFWSIGGSWIW